MDDLRKAAGKSDQSSTTTDALDLFDDEPTGGGTAPMTPGQRFLVAMLLLVTVVVIGVTFLLVTQRIWLH